MKLSLGFFWTLISIPIYVLQKTRFRNFQSLWSSSRNYFILHRGNVFFWDLKLALPWLPFWGVKRQEEENDCKVVSGKTFSTSTILTQNKRAVLLSKNPIGKIGTQESWFYHLAEVIGNLKLVKVKWEFSNPKFKDF